MQDIEAIVSQDPEGKRPELRLWLRLLSCGNIISGHIRRRLREDFQVTLPRFDVMAQLHRCPDGLRLGELSQRLMVTGGNLTGVIDALLRDGMVSREQVPSDRRSAVVRLTKAGERAFSRMAEAHETWLQELFAGLSRGQMKSMTQDLDILKRSARRREGTARNETP